MLGWAVLIGCVGCCSPGRPRVSLVQLGLGAASDLTPDAGLRAEWVQTCQNALKLDPLTSTRRYEPGVLRHVWRLSAPWSDSLEAVCCDVYFTEEGASEASRIDARVLLLRREDGRTWTVVDYGREADEPVFYSLPERGLLLAIAGGYGLGRAGKLCLWWCDAATLSHGGEWRIEAEDEAEDPAYSVHAGTRSSMRIRRVLRDKKAGLLDRAASVSNDLGIAVELEFIAESSR